MAQWRESAGAEGNGAGVVVIDAEPVYATGLQVLVRQAAGLTWLGRARDAAQARELCGRSRPALVCVDYRQDPHLHVAAELASVGILVLLVVPHNHRTPALLPRVGEGGVHAVISRDSSIEHLFAAIRATLVHGHYRDPDLAVPAAAAGHPGGLSRREFDVLIELAAGHDYVTTARNLYVSRETVRTHAKAIMRKLAVHDRSAVIARAYRDGLITPADVPAPGAGAGPVRGTPHDATRAFLRNGPVPPARTGSPAPVVSTSVVDNTRGPVAPRACGD